MTIQNVGGPDRSIPTADTSRGELLISKRYRNRRLDEYLKELEMTEGRSTGIPTIQNVLKAILQNPKSLEEFENKFSSFKTLCLS